MLALVYSLGLFTDHLCPLPELRAGRHLIWELCSDAGTVLCLQTDSVCPLLSPLMSEMGETTHSQPPVQLRAPPASPRVTSCHGLSTAMACLCTRECLREGWNGSCRRCHLAELRLLCGEGGAACCDGSPALRAYAICGDSATKTWCCSKMDVRSSLCSSLSFPEGSVLILAVCRILLVSAWIPSRWGPGGWGSRPISFTTSTVPFRIYQAGVDWCRSQLWNLISWR